MAWQYEECRAGQVRSEMTETVQEKNIVTDGALDVLFREARTLRKWRNRPVELELLRRVYDLAKLGPTNSNLTPARFVFLTSEEAKQRLLPLMWEGNREQTRTAPVVVLVAYDTKFYEHAGKLIPGRDPKPLQERFEQNAESAERIAFQSGTLQGAYLLLAARALGLDAGPMGGFDSEAINREFFAGTSYRVNFVANLGYGDRTGLRPRQPRLEFDEVATIL